MEEGVPFHFGINQGADMKRFRCLYLFVIQWCLVCAGILLVYCACLAQEAPKPRATSIDLILQNRQVKLHATKQSLAEIVKSLYPQIGRGILVDGIPVVQQADFDFEGSAKEALDKVAETYDFAWSLSKRGVILMRKQYHRPDEYPQMNLPELREAANDVVTILHSFPYDTDKSHWPDVLTKLYSSLTPEQAQRLRTKNLSTADLSPPQLSLLHDAIFGNAFAGAFTAWERLVQRLDLLPKGYLQTQISPFYGQQKEGKPVLELPNEPTRLQLIFFAPGPYKPLPGDIPYAYPDYLLYLAYRRWP